MSESQSTPVAPPDAPPVGGYDFAPFRLDVNAYELLRDGERVDVTSKAFDTLLLLIRERHRVVTKDELLARVWRDTNVTDDSLIQCVSSIRRALGDEAARPRFVTTVARRGYRFVAPITEWSVSATGTPAAGLADMNVSAPGAATTSPATATVETRRTRSLLWPAVAVVCVIAGWALGARLSDPGRLPSPGGLLRFSQAAPPGSKITSGGALSPDGLYLAFVAEDASTGRNRLWVRALDAAQPRLFEGTEGASRPFWSPDSQFIGFFSAGHLRTIRVSGGASTDLATVGPRPSGAAWSPRGEIIFSTWLSGFSRISASGGAPSTLTELAPGEAAHAWPQFLPDGDHFIYYVYGGPSPGATYVGQLSTGTHTRLLETDAGAVYSPLGYLLFTRAGILTAQRFDPSALALEGSPFNVVTGNVTNPSMTNGTMLSASTGGLIAFGGGTGESELAWFDRAGRRLAGLSTQAPLHNPRLSADGKEVYANTFPPAQAGVWLVDVERDATRRLIPLATLAIPSPDGRQIAVVSSKADGTSGIAIVPAEGNITDMAPTLALSAERKSLTDWTRDGRYLLYQTLAPRRGQDLWLLPRETDGTPVPLIQTSANEIQGQVSPDGRWLAYASDESGQWEVYVQSFPDGTMKQTISPAGGTEPQWRADGRELFYLSEDHALMSVALTPGGTTMQVDRPRELFRPVVFGEPTTYLSHYAVTSDGQRFLVDVLQDPALDPITVLLNWTARGQ